MCVIVFKPTGAKMPPLALLKHCWDKNPDGAGVAVSETKSVYLRKGFMKWGEFEAFFNEQGFEKRTGQAIVMHFRIGTHGKKDAGNTHPFCVSPDPEKLRTVFGRYPVAMAHNGIFQDEPSVPLISDTGQFIVDCCNRSGGDLEAHWKANPKSVGWSKMVILKPGGEFRLLGSWQVTDMEGGSECFFSNLTWKPYISTGGYSGGGYSGYYDRYEDGYEDMVPKYRGCGDNRGWSRGVKTYTSAEEDAWVLAQLAEYGIVQTRTGSSTAWALGGKYAGDGSKTKPSEVTA